MRLLTDVSGPRDTVYYGDEFHVYGGYLSISVSEIGTYDLILYSAQNGKLTKVSEQRISTSEETYVVPFSDVTGRLAVSLNVLSGKASVDVTITSISGTMLLPVADLLDLEPALGTVAYPTDQPTGKLVYTATGWAGNLGVFASSSALSDVSTDALSGSNVTAYVVDLGFAALALDKSKWLYSLVAELP